jgi:hypothetical protein
MCTKIFSSGETCQCWVKIQRFGNLLPLYHSTSTLTMETKVISETLVFNSTMTRLMTREGFSRLKDFCFCTNRFCVCNWQLVGLYLTHESHDVLMFIQTDESICVRSGTQKSWNAEGIFRNVSLPIFLVRSLPSYLPIQNWTIYKASALSGISLREKV